MPTCRSLIPVALPLAVLLAGAALATPLGAADLPPIVALSPHQVRAAGIETVAPRPAAEGGLRHLPARIGIPNAQQRVVGTPLAGLLVEILAAPGDLVKQGQELARIASPELLAVQRELAQAQAEHELARRNRARDEALFADGIIAGSRLEAARIAERQAAAVLTEKSAVRALAGARDAVGGRLSIVAPITGVVLAQLAQTGARLEAAAPIFHLARLSPLNAEVQVPAAEAARLRPGLEVVVPSVGARGTISAIGRAVDAAQTVTVRALLTDGLETLGPGQLVEADIEAPAAANGPSAWRLPAGALVRVGRESRGVVFVHRAEGFAPLAAEAVGEGGGEVVLRVALSADDRVVAKGASTLKAVVAGIGQGG